MNLDEGLEENVGGKDRDNDTNHEKGEEKEEGRDDEEEGHVLFALHTKGKHFLQELRDSDAQVLFALRALADL